MKVKIDTVKVVKIVGVVLGIAGTLATGWAGSKENTKTIEKLVEDHLNETKN